MNWLWAFIDWLLPTGNTEDDDFQIDRRGDGDRFLVERFLGPQAYENDGWVRDGLN